MARIESLDVLLDPEGKMLLAEAYDGVIENVQKGTISGLLKNTDLSGDPTAGTVEAKRFANATSKEYGTARTNGKGDAVKGKPVTIPIDTDREFIEELEQKDVSLLGVEGLIGKRATNHTQRLIAELDKVFFATTVAAGTEYEPEQGVTEIVDILDAMAVQLGDTENEYIDGIDKSLMAFVVNGATYSKIRKYLDTVSNPNVNSAQGEFTAFHGIPVFESNRLPKGVKVVLQMVGSVAQPVRSSQYAAERIPLSEAIALELFFYYGCKAVTPETILYYGTPVTP